ncbi:hypothetical protein [Candidatus Hoaglandella endobia]|uniref:hypothetical protein n=1 Tax=Candidatus Hoaglandella endobia TaxID=1778263 RepID=UPI00131514C5|nr:hypothetical protein [Candidatus Hoaglandella endobia]
MLDQCVDGYREYLLLVRDLAAPTKSLKAFNCFPLPNGDTKTVTLSRLPKHEIAIV